MHTEYFFERIVKNRTLGEYASAFGMRGSKFTDYLQENAGNVVLDLGCGEGQALRQMREVDGLTAVRFVGVDWRPLNMSNPCVAADFKNLPFKNESVDLVLAVASLGFYAESEEELERHFKEVSRIMKHGGRLLIVLEPKIMLESRDLSRRWRIQQAEYHYYPPSEYIRDSVRHYQYPGLTSITLAVAATQGLVYKTARLSQDENLYSCVACELAKK